MPEPEPIKLPDEKHLEDPKEMAAPRSLGSWVILGALFALLIITPLLGDKPADKSSGIDATELESSLKMAMLARTFADSAKIKAPATSTVEVDPLKTIYDKVFPKRATDSLAARLTLSVGYELGLNPDPKALATLEKGKSSSDRNYAAVYSSKTLKPEWVQSARAGFPSTFLGKVVLKHALAKSDQSEAAKKAITTLDAVPVGIVIVGALLSFAIGVVVIIGGILMLASGENKAKGHSFTGLTRADADRLALRMALFLILMIFVPSLFAYVFLGKLPDMAGSIIGQLVLLGVFWLVCKTPILGVADPFKKLIGSTENWPKLVGFGFLAFFANLPFVLILALLAQQLLPNAPAPTHPLSDELGSGANPFTIAMMFFAATVMAPILEELSFRGLLFPALTKYMKPVVAMLLSGCLFGMVHPQGPVLWASLAAIGSMSAFLTYRTGSLIPSMVMHAVHNASILTLSMVLIY